MHDLGHIPILLAPIVDRSFYAFQERRGGLHAQYLYHVFDPRDAAIAAQVKEVFRLGHVWAGADPPRNFELFVRRVPELVTRWYGDEDDGVDGYDDDADVPTRTTTSAR